MKFFLPLLFLVLSHSAFAQVNSVLSTDANSFYQNAMTSIKPAVKSLIEKNANKLTGHRVNVDSLIKELHKNALLKNGNEKDLDAITALILVQTSKNTDTELKNMVIHMKQAESENESYKTTAALFVQIKSDIAATVSLIMKKISGSSEMAMDKFK